MNTQKFYIPISRNKLAHFFGRGVIVPSKYLENCQKDIQNRFDDYILFSKSKFTTETDCCIEVVLDAEELKKVESISESFSIFDRPLAISRVTAIYFRNEEERDNTIYSVTKNNGDAFIPTRLQHIANEERLDTAELDGGKCEPNSKDWSEDLNRFDQLMGGLSLLKLCSKEDGVYPSGYYATLANLNKLFLPESEDYKFNGIFKEKEIDPNYLKLFRELVYSELDKNKVKEFAEKEVGVEVKEQYGDIVLENINNKSLRILVIIATYGAFGSTKKVDEFIYSFYQSTLNVKSLEQEVALCFGINKGYSTFNNQYSISDLHIRIKFKLENESDYHIIESIYQNVFYDKEEFDSSSIVEHQKSILDEYYDPVTGDIIGYDLMVKKKSRIGFFELSKISSQKYSMDESNTKLNKNIVKVASFVTNLLKVSVNSINYKIIELKENYEQLGSQFSKLKEKIESNYLSKSEIQNEYVSKAETANLEQFINQKVVSLEGRFNQDIERTDKELAKSEESLAELRSDLQSEYASKTETANLEKFINQKVVSLEGQLNQNIERADKELARSEEVLTGLQLELQSKYASKAETADLEKFINQKVVSLEGQLNQNIERTDKELAKSEESLASLKSEVQNNYVSKEDLKQIIESSYLHRDEVDNLIKLRTEEISKSVGDLKAQLEVSIELNDKQEKTNNALNTKIDDLEERLNSLEQKLVQPIMSKTSNVQLKNKISGRSESETGDLFDDDAEPLNEERVTELTKLKRDELNEIAETYGLLHTTYRTKSDIAAAIAYWEASNDHDN